MSSVFLALWLLSAPLPGVLAITGQPADPFVKPAQARVLLFVRTDCPITNRYAPELQRIAQEFGGRGVEFWLVYADRAETPEAIVRHMDEFHLPGAAVRDRQHQLVKRAQATVAPQAAVFDAHGALMYSGRIDDRFAEIGKARPAPTTHDLESAIAAVLAGRAPSPARTRAIGCYLADVQ